MQTVFTYEPNRDSLIVNKSEIYRYLGYKTGMDLPKEIETSVEEILDNVLKQSVPKVCYKYFETKVGEQIDFGFMSVESKALASNLENCTETVIFGATIGIYTDRQIQKEQILSPARALIYQAVGATVVEAVCDDFNEWIRQKEQEKGRDICPRFSPGYGDVSLSIQKSIFQELSLAKLAGITLTDSLLMIPEKSVTAIIGIKNKK